MERLQIPRLEAEQTKDDDPRRVVSEQLSNKYSKALAQIQEAEQQASELQATINIINKHFSLPTVYIDVAYIHTEFDIYTHSEEIREVRQYALATDSLTEAIKITAQYITESGIVHKNHFEPRIKGIAIGFSSDQIIPLEITDELGLQRHFKPE